MLSKEKIIELVNRTGVSRKETILLILSFNQNIPKQTREITSLGKGFGVRSIEKWNISQILIDIKDFAIKLPEGWILSSSGVQYLSDLPSINFKRKAVKIVASDLKNLISSLRNKDTQTFLHEALICFETGCYRACIVLSWVGAIHLLYNHVYVNALKDFNNEGTKRDIKWKLVKTIDDFGRTKEKDFLEMIGSIGIIGKNVKKELEICLDLRNGCGHPNSLILGENRTASHLESLILNVYTKFQ